MGHMTRINFEAAAEMVERLIEQIREQEAESASRD